MILPIYLLKRFFKYLLLTSSLFVILFNSIDFFEKFIRIKEVSLYDISYPVLLNILPSLFEYLPLSSWLSTILLIKELHQQKEWDIFPLLNIRYKQILNLFLATGISLSLFSFVGKEKIAFPLLYKSEQFKNEKLKRKNPKLIIDKWLILPNDIFCYFSVIDIEKQIGSNLLLVQMNQKFFPEKILTAPSFAIDLEQELLNIKKGTELNSESNNQNIIENKQIHMPSFFSQIQMILQINSLKQIIQTLFSSKNTIPYNCWNELFQQFLKRILFHLQLILYPLLTLCLFFSFLRLKKYKWLLILLPYPALTLLAAISDFFIQNGVSAWISTLPYVILLSLTIILWQNLKITPKNIS